MKCKRCNDTGMLYSRATLSGNDIVILNPPEKCSCKAGRKSKSIKNSLVVWMGIKDICCICGKEKCKHLMKEDENEKSKM